CELLSGSEIETVERSEDFTAWVAISGRIDGVHRRPERDLDNGLVRRRLQVVAAVDVTERNNVEGPIQRVLKLPLAALQQRCLERSGQLVTMVACEDT